MQDQLIMLLMLQIQAPVVHVNGDDPEVVKAVKIACKYRAKFKRYCY